MLRRADEIARSAQSAGWYSTQTDDMWLAASHFGARGDSLHRRYNSGHPTRPRPPAHITLPCPLLLLSNPLFFSTPCWWEVQPLIVSTFLIWSCSKVEPGFVRFCLRRTQLNKRTLLRRTQLNKQTLFPPADNHVWSAGSISAAVAKAKVAAGFTSKIEVEARTLEEGFEAVGMGNG